MKILSIAVPCYNSQEYMRKCVDSLLKGGEDVEILIVDDGSKDDTLKIARDYEEKYPTIVKAIHQENKGHGGAVNTGNQPVSADAFDDLQDRASAGMWSETAGAYILCGQSGGIYSAGECAEHVLSGCKSVPLLYRKSRSVR